MTNSLKKWKRKTLSRFEKRKLKVKAKRLVNSIVDSMHQKYLDAGTITRREVEKYRSDLWDEVKTRGREKGMAGLAMLSLREGKRYIGHKGSWKIREASINLPDVDVLAQDLIEEAHKRTRSLNRRTGRKVEKATYNYLEPKRKKAIKRIDRKATKLQRNIEERLIRSRLGEIASGK